MNRLPIKNRFCLPIVLFGFGLLLPGGLEAQTFTTLHTFGGSDGGDPRAGLILSGNTFYGTTLIGGPSPGVGTVFAVNIDGTGFTSLHGFTFGGSDGANPWAGLVLSDNTLYGVGNTGGKPGYGTVFSVNTDGTGFSVLHTFSKTPFLPPYTNSDGATPYAGLVLSSNTLYGTTGEGGTWGNGTVFKVNTDGTGFTNLYMFSATPFGIPAPNSDGALPYAGLILSGSRLYGTCYQGGDSGNGTVFALDTDGTGFTNLHSFTGGSDGANPRSGLILSGNTLFGTAVNAGDWGNGTVFALNTDGTGFETLHGFAATSGGSYPTYTNPDGLSPYAGLILSGNTLYGTTEGGGSLASGTVFAVNSDGTGFKTLYTFTATPHLSPFVNNDGANPWAGLILVGNTLYGTTTIGGSSAYSDEFGHPIRFSRTLIRG